MSADMSVAMSTFLDSFEAASLRYRGRVLTGDWRHCCFDWDELPIDEGDEDEIGSCTCLVHPVEVRDNGPVTFLSAQEDYGIHHAIACSCGQILTISLRLFASQESVLTERQQADVRAFKEDHSGGDHVLTYTMVELTPVGVGKLTLLKD